MFNKQEKVNIITLMKAGVKSLDLDPQSLIMAGILMDKIQKLPEEKVEEKPKQAKKEEK